MLPVPRHHLLFNFLTVQSVQAVAGERIHGFTDLILDELLVSDRPIECLFLEAVLPLIEVIFHDIGGPRGRRRFEGNGKGPRPAVDEYLQSGSRGTDGVPVSGRGWFLSAEQTGRP